MGTMVAISLSISVINERAEWRVVGLRKHWCNGKIFGRRDVALFQFPVLPHDSMPLPAREKKSCDSMRNARIEMVARRSLFVLFINIRAE